MNVLCHKNYYSLKNKKMSGYSENLLLSGNDIEHNCKYLQTNLIKDPVHSDQPLPLCATLAPKLF
jgi:hypothetical protein